MQDDRLVRGGERQVSAEDPDVPDPRVPLSTAARRHGADAGGGGPRGGGQGSPADDLRVDLGKLAVPPLLRLLVSEHVPRAVQLERLRAAAEVGDVEPEDRGRELRSEREVPASLVLERIQFADDCGAGLRREELEALERRRGDLAEPERFGELDEPRLDEATLRHVLGTPIVGPAGPFEHRRRRVSVSYHKRFWNRDRDLPAN